MDDFLESVWLDFNEKFFANELRTLNAIDWGETSGPGGIRAHGLYVHASRCIIIDEQFKVLLDGDSVTEGSPGDLQIASGLMLHEMVHQSLHEKGAPSPGQHGASFFAEVQRIGRLSGFELPLGADMTRWPLLL